MAARFADMQGQRAFVGTTIFLAALALLSAAPSSASATELPATIKENTTLTAVGNPYTGATVTVESGVTLKAEPGVKFNVSALVVKGTLKAEGTSEAPVLFTSQWKEPKSGDWQNIKFESGSGGVIDYAEVRYGGFINSSAAIEITAASPTITHTVVRNNKWYGIRATGASSPEIAYNEVKSNVWTGISYFSTSGGGEVNIHDNFLEANGGGIGVTSEGSAFGRSLGKNTVASGSGVSYEGKDIPPDIATNSLSPTAKLSISGTVSQSATWANSGYVFAVANNLPLTIASGATLTLKAGVVYEPESVVVKGALNTEGTTKEPVVITRGSTAGTWRNIKFESGSSGVIDHAEVRYGGSANSSAAIEITDASPTITNSVIRNNSWYGIRAIGASAPEIAYNEVKNNPSTGIAFNSSKSGEVNIHDNLLEGTGASIGVTSSGTATGHSLGHNTTLSGGSVSYEGSDVPPDISTNTVSATGKLAVSGTVIQSATWTNPGHNMATANNGTLTIASGATLTLKAGVVYEPEGIVVKGALKTEGTTGAPVVFTRGSTAGTWRNIKFESGASGALDHAEVRYGGSVSSSAAIEINSASPTVTNSVVRNNKWYGIAISGASAPDIAYNEVKSNTWSGIFFNSSSASAEVNIHDNVLEANGGGIGVTSEGSAFGRSLGKNTVVSGGGITYEGKDVPPDIATNTLSPAAKLSVSGTVAQSATWTNSGYRFVVANNLPLTIASGATLTLKAGVIYEPENVVVKGTLKAEGTTKEPVVITRGSTAGSWRNIKFESGSSGLLDHAEVRYGGSPINSGVIEISGASPTITHSVIRNNSWYGVKVNSGTPSIEWTTLSGNPSQGLNYGGAGTLNAPHNYWGCASGPRPAGCGDGVSGNVNWKPQAEEDSPLGKCRGRETQCEEGADPVSLATGFLAYSHRDLLLTNKGRIPLEFVRAYNSSDRTDSGLGPGWSQTGLASVTELENGDALVRRQDGRQDVFQKAEGAYLAPSGITDSLAKVEGNFQLTTLQGTVYRFDSSGRIVSITDDHGLKTTYAYNAEGRLATITDPSAQTLTFAYNGSNHITSVKDSTGREVKYTYSGAGDLASVTDALGGITEFTYDTEHRLKTIKDPRGNVILKNSYDAQGRITEQRDGLESLWKLKYEPSETIVTEPEGGKLAYGFDAQSRVVSETDQLGRKTTTSYDAEGNVDEVIQPGGAKWEFGHDAAGNLTSVLDPEGGERSYEYDAQNHLTEYTDAEGGIWSYEWSKANDLTKVADPESGETTFTYNESGQPLSSTDPNKHKTEFTYDTRGNRLSSTDALSHKTSFEYNSRNYLISRTAPGLKAEGFERNALGDLLTRTTPEGNKTKYAYDANGMPTQITDPGEGVWKIAYNAMERPTAYTDPLEQQTKVSYNGNLKPTKVVNRRGKETTYGYDLANQVTAVHAPEGGDWTFGYDGRGNRSSMVDPREGETTYEYDLLNRMTEAVEPMETTSEYGYDAEGNLTSVTDPRGNATAYAYDELGRLIEVAQPLEKTTSLEYDPAGNLLAKSNAAGTLEYSYDAANRLAAIEAGEATLRSYGYDTANRLTSAVDPESHKIEIGYDGDGRETSIKDGRGQSLTRTYNSRDLLTKQVDGRGTLEYGYDKLGQLTSLTDPQGKATSFAYDPEGDLKEVKRPSGVITTNVYDDAGRLAETTSKDELGATLEALEYGYDPAGNITSRYDVRLEEETTFAYDPLERLTEFDPPGEGATAYAYDPAGNRTEADGTTYEYNALNQLTESSGGIAYGYDGAGRLKNETTGGEETTYTWDLFDHLASVESEAGSTSYAYDALGRPSQRTSGPASQVMHYGDLSDLATYDANGKGEITASYVQGAKGLLEERTGSTAYPLADAHGDIVAMTSAGGAVESRQSFDPWGVQLSGPERAMGYLGSQERRGDPVSGLIQMGERSYAPGLGAFLSEDPVLGHPGSGMSADRYLYVRNNPLNRYDLSGRDVCVPTPFGDACAEDAAEDIGDTATDVWNWTKSGRHWIGDRARDFWKVGGGYVESCLRNAAWGALGGAAIGATAAGAGAVPGAIGGGLSGCGTGLVEEGLRDAGQDTAAGAVEVGSAAKDVGRGARGLVKESPELPERLKDVWHVFF